MILPEHRSHHQRLAALGVFTAPMLMLGNQDDRTGEAESLFGKYQTLDPDGGDIHADLAGDLSEYHGAFATVYNLGTIEHLWDCHRAYSNAARLVRLGGHFVGHSPVAGYEQHGVHVTAPEFILGFFRLNGFEIIAHWFSDKNGREVARVERGGGNVLLWFAARKIAAVEFFQPPQQRFVGGVPV